MHMRWLRGRSPGVMLAAVVGALLLLPTVALASTGEPLWAAYYSGPGHSTDNASALAVSPDGTRVYVTGTSIGTSGNYDYATVAYDAQTGVRLWSKRYKGPANGDDGANAIAVSPDGARVYVTGYSEGAVTGEDYATIAYDATTGARLWITRYSGPDEGYDAANAIAVSPNGTLVFVTGTSDGLTPGLPDYATVAYDADSGARVWARRYNGAGNEDDDATALGVSPDGSRVYVTGSSTGATTSHDFATIAYDATNGDTIWTKRYSSSGFGNDGATTLGLSPDGTRVYVAGYSGPNVTEWATIAYDAGTGTRLWVKRFNGPVGRPGEAYALGVSPDGTRVFVTGYTITATQPVYATVAYDAATGARLWGRLYAADPGDSSVATALGVSPDGTRVYVTGASEHSDGSSDYATLAYDAATGVLAWARRYNGRGGNYQVASGIGVAPSGDRVYVTGSSNLDARSSAYQTIAYDTA